MLWLLCMSSWKVNCCFQDCVFCFCCFCMQAMHVLVLHNLLVFLQFDRKEKKKKNKKTCVYFKDLTSAIWHYLYRPLQSPYPHPSYTPPPNYCSGHSVKKGRRHVSNQAIVEKKKPNARLNNTCSCWRPRGKTTKIGYPNPPKLDE